MKETAKPKPEQTQNPTPWATARVTVQNTEITVLFPQQNQDEKSNKQNNVTNKNI